MVCCTFMSVWLRENATNEFADRASTVESHRTLEWHNYIVSINMAQEGLS